MHDLLYSLGFKVRCLIGRVINNQDIDVPRTHRTTLLELNGDKYIIDVGFGSMCPKTPLKIGDTTINSQNYRIMKIEKNNYQLEIFKNNKPFILYTFDLNDYTQSDCLIGNFYSSKHPKAVFVNNLVISLIKEDVILSLRNKHYHRIYSTHTNIVEIKDFMQLHSVVNDDFGVNLSVDDCRVLFVA